MRKNSIVALNTYLTEFANTAVMAKIIPNSIGNDPVKYISPNRKLHCQPSDAIAVDLHAARLWVGPPLAELSRLVNSC